MIFHRVHLWAGNVSISSNNIKITNGDGDDDEDENVTNQI